MRHTQETNGRRNRVLRGIAAAFAAMTLSTLVLPSFAMADVYPEDVIHGKSVAERELDMAVAPNVVAPAVSLVDTDGETYFQRNDLEERKIASTTKLMTALLAVENGSPEDIIVVTDADLVGGSTAELMAGDQLTLHDALLGLMLPSGNDAAMAIARTLGARFGLEGQDPYEAFIAKMNSRAQELGMTQTLYANPSGLDDAEWTGDHHSTAKDLSILAVEAFKNDWFKEIVGTKNATIHPTNNGAQREVPLESTDALLGSNPGFLGGKTGNTPLAGCCFVGACERDGKTYISVVLGEENRDMSFADTTELLQWVFRHERTYQLGENDGTKTDDGRPVIAEIPHTDWIDKTIALTIADPETKTHAFDLDGEITQNAHFEPAKGDIKKGEVLGAIELKQDNKVIDKLELVAAEDSEAPSFLRSLFIGIDRFFRSLTGQPTMASQKSHFADANTAGTSDKEGEDGQSGEDAQEGTQDGDQGAAQEGADTGGEPVADGTTGETTT